jgi:phage/plasmid-like protein (TIGR03299 family)
MTEQEAYEGGHLNYNVEKWPLAAVNPLTGELVSAGNGNARWATVRVNADGSTQYLSDVGSQYKVVQNKTAFDIVRAVTQLEDVQYETAGVLDHGRRVFVLAHMKFADFIIQAEDKVSAYLGVATSHDGSMELGVFGTNVRWVCQNTLSAGIAEAEGRGTAFRVRHDQNAMDHVAEAQAVLGFAVDYQRQFAQLAEALSSVRFEMPDMEELCVRVYPANRETGNVSHMAMQARAETQMLFALDGARTPASANTAWSAWNAVGERADWKPSRIKGEALTDSILFGSRAKVKDEALHHIADISGDGLLASFVPALTGAGR